jgi:hypothetical protein
MLMKILLSVFLFALSAQASTHKFTCHTDVEDKKVTIKFSVEDLFGKKPQLLENQDNPDETIQVTPKKSSLTELNDNLSFGVGEKELNIKGDADGIYQVGLALYRNSGFTLGFVRAQGDVKFYATVKCDIKVE